MFWEGGFWVVFCRGGKGGLERVGYVRGYIVKVGGWWGGGLFVCRFCLFI